MNLFGNDCFPQNSSMPSEDDFLIKKLLLTHDPDGRSLDSELLLRAMENVMCYAATSQVCGFHIDAIAKDDVSDIEVVGSQETLAQIIDRIKIEMLRKHPGKENLHTRTMILFDVLGNYRWDVKMVLTLAAFAAAFGEFCIIMQQCPCNPLAVSVSMLKHLPRNLSTLKPQFRALSLLVRTAMDVTKCIIKLEGLPFRYARLDDETMVIAKSWIYVATYWVTRSMVACTSQIRDIKAKKPEQVRSDSTLIAAWELSSLAYKLSSICTHLRRQVDLCHQQMEEKMHQKLLKVFQEVHPDNQDVLGILLATKDELPIKNSSTQHKLGVSEVKDKVVLILVSKAELLPLEGLLLLLERTYDHHHHKKLEGSYEIVWISVSDTWTDSERDMFDFLSNSLPWYSVRRPWVLYSAVVNYIKQEWGYKNAPLIVVLDSQGMVTNSNAMDMVFIWGARAYPFSSSKEEQLWDEENWTLKLLLDEIDPLLTTWVEEGRNICIYGSDNLDWIREFNAKFKVIRNAGVQLEMVYAGCKDLSEQVRRMSAVIGEELHRNLFTFTKLHFFWLRLESIRRSKLKLGQTIHSDDHILKEVSALLDTANEGWVIIGRGNTADIVRLSASDAVKWLDRFPEWEANVTKLGFVSALRAAIDPSPPPPPPPGPCNHSKVVPYAEGLTEETVLCEKCMHPMKKYVVYE
ncbi:PROTEIN SIEVE ELEMENT OCCLUSION B-LIKE [Salix koriyanagi]|uniref:PROTEIN SIEVE ELEMENT OCCLUSION B-LIKE n=2 Tax=Salix koriyanagi TaxID=2511006 RepID=A0A9Q0WQV4_9ROSI|nr:PROTEIN SIEVE ELEMENT OCCLUSION B-LIKE [Salix koriyanagi]